MANPYFIKIELPEDTEKSAVASTGKKSTGNSSSSNSDGMGKIENKLKQMVSFAAIKSTADQIATHEISQVSLRTGAVEYEQRLSAQYSVASQVVGAGAALITAGISSGPAGIAVVAMGLAASGVNKLIGIYQKEQTLRTEQNLENISIGMQSVRAGTNGRRSANQ